jgi:hypothetical protein
MTDGSKGLWVNDAVRGPSLEDPADPGTKAIGSRPQGYEPRHHHREDAVLHRLHDLVPAA